MKDFCQALDQAEKDGIVRGNDPFYSNRSSNLGKRGMYGNGPEATVITWVATSYVTGRAMPDTFTGALFIYGANLYTVLIVTVILIALFNDTERNLVLDAMELVPFFGIILLLALPVLFILNTRKMPGYAMMVSMRASYVVMFFILFLLGAIFVDGPIQWPRALSPLLLFIGALPVRTSAAIYLSKTPLVVSVMEKAAWISSKILDVDLINSIRESIQSIVGDWRMVGFPRILRRLALMVLAIAGIGGSGASEVAVSVLNFLRALVLARDNRIGEALFSEASLHNINANVGYFELLLDGIDLFVSAEWVSFVSFLATSLSTAAVLIRTAADNVNFGIVRLNCIAVFMVAASPAEQQEKWLEMYGLDPMVGLKRMTPGEVYHVIAFVDVLRQSLASVLSEARRHQQEGRESGVTPQEQGGERAVRSRGAGQPVREVPTRAGLLLQAVERIKSRMQAAVTEGLGGVGEAGDQNEVVKAPGSNRVVHPEPQTRAQVSN